MLGGLSEKSCPVESVIPSNTPCHGACFLASSRQGAVITPPSAPIGAGPTEWMHLPIPPSRPLASVLGPRTRWPALQDPSEPRWTGCDLTLTPTVTHPAAPTRAHSPVSFLTHGPLAQHRCGVLCLGTRSCKFHLMTSLTTDEQVGFKTSADEKRKPNVFSNRLF